MRFEITKIKSKKRDGYTENPNSTRHHATILSLSCPESLVSPTAIATVSQATEANGDRAKEEYDERCDDKPDGRGELRSYSQVIRAIHMALHNFKHDKIQHKGHECCDPCNECDQAGTQEPDAMRTRSGEPSNECDSRCDRVQDQCSRKGV